MRTVDGSDTASSLDHRQLHLVLDNYAAHKHPNVKAWPWLNLVEGHPFIWTKPADDVLDKIKRKRTR
jgi:hypothetical protein